MKAKFLLVSALMIAIGISNAEAQTIKKRAKNQHARVKQGVKSGELTAAEAKNVRNDQKEIRQEAKEAKADGVVTPAEKQEIRKDQRKASRKIYRKKHNNRDRN